VLADTAGGAMLLQQVISLRRILYGCDSVIVMKRAETGLVEGQVRLEMEQKRG